MYKLLAVDMDGTLLDHKQEISEENKRAIQRAMEKGVKIVISSGRAITGIERYIEELGLLGEEDYSVTCSGACVINNAQTKILEEKYISYDEFQYVFEVARKYNIYLNIYTENRILVHWDNYSTRIDSAANRLPMEIVDFHNLDKDVKIMKMTLINEDASIKEELLSVYPNIPVSDIDLPTRDKFDKRLFADAKKFLGAFSEKFTLLKTTPYHIEVLSKETNKGAGVQRVADIFDIKPEEIICIGDSGNDRHMIEYAGLGIAMGNASPELKKAADYVTLSNQENGVAHVIEKFIL
ncbi:Cof-type HAD-IIB family hydrolase [Thermotalea metallivorans]|uniref:Sugar phosphatase YidA n=1 Tax=Thermotalea metallivorans TaxID=520762 RepID=A0A140LBT3_9FIRM|nr:Cof-type HAD-IIB family hydrolase [Thermotalea metallivorans]KXG78008.1 Sugar phosphatase YidA [Thermotalea metallivorans]